MRIRVGCELGFEFTQPTPLIAMLNVHFSRASDLELPDHLTTNPPVPIGSYRDSFDEVDDARSRHRSAIG